MKFRSFSASLFLPPAGCECCASILRVVLCSTRAFQRSTSDALSAACILKRNHSRVCVCVQYKATYHKKGAARRQSVFMVRSLSAHIKRICPPYLRLIPSYFVVNACDDDALLPPMDMQGVEARLACVLCCRSMHHFQPKALEYVR
jgi:hypothetical protein